MHNNLQNEEVRLKGFAQVLFTFIALAQTLASHQREICL